MGRSEFSGLVSGLFFAAGDAYQTDRIFTREAISRPLFEEPGDHIVREDPLSGPQGFMVGDEFIPTQTEMAQQYFDAAHLLLEAIKRGDWKDYKLISPALYLFGTRSNC